jgi:hypothetical protein
MERKYGPPLGIQTLEQLQAANRRLDRRRAGVNKLLAAMQHPDASLHLSYRNGRPLWQLSTGEPVSPHVAEIVIKTPNIVSVGDSLFPGHPGQTWRYVNG